MAISEEKINLTKEDILGKGFHKTTYVHPKKKHLCIKIVHSTPDTDLDREMAYRSALKFCKKEKSSLTAYHGTVETNLGTGYIFDRVINFDGTACIDFKYLLEYPQEAEDKLGTKLFDIFAAFRDLMLKEYVVVSDTDPVNFMIQRTSPSTYIFKIVDNIGTPALIPLVYYLDFLAIKRSRKYWQRFVARCQETNDALFSEAEWSQLKQIV